MVTTVNDQTSLPGFLGLMCKNRTSRITARIMNQLNSVPSARMKFFFASIYMISEEGFAESAAVLMAFTMTVAAAVPSRFMAVPTRVWSALKLMAATASSSE